MSSNPDYEINSSSLQTSKVPLTISEFNSDDKIEQTNKLINTLSKRKRISIIIAMLIFFQEKNYPKVLKDYLIEGVKKYIQLNPGRVISYNGEPFTKDNCLRGMRVVIGKHRVIQKETIDGAEYLHVNLTQATIFLSDEISKICQGPRGNRAIHCSLADEPKLQFQNGKLNMIGNNIIGDKRKRSLNTKDDEEENKGNNYAGDDDFDEDISDGNSKLDMRDDDEFSIGQEEKILNNNQPRAHIINIGDSDEGENEGENFVKPEINMKNCGDNPDNTENNLNYEDKIHLDEIDNKDKKQSDNFGEDSKTISKSNYNSSINDFDEISIKPKGKNPRKKDKNKNILDLNKSKYSFQDKITIKNIGKSSQVNNYLRENKEAIIKYYELFETMQKIGQEGQKNLERLEKLNLFNNQEDSKSQMENDDDKENEMEDIFREFGIKKDNLVRIYKRIQSTVQSIYSLSNNPDINFIKEDINYLNINSKIYNDLIEEIFPFFDKINSQTRHFSIAKITKNLQKISDSLKDNDVGFKNFFVFVNSMINRIPMGAIRGNTLCDVLGDDIEDVNERKKQFYEILNKEKENLFKVIETILNQFNGNKIKNNDEIIQDEEKTKDKESNEVEAIKEKQTIKVQLLK